MSGSGGGGNRNVSDPTLASKRVCYVGGLPDQVSIPLIRAAFIPFGTIRSVDMPMDYVAGTHKGFCFVEYEDADDAEEAVFNMDCAELLGRTIKVTLAQPNQVNKLSSSSGTGTGTNEAIWKSDEWFQTQMNSDKDPAHVAEQEIRQQDVLTLQKMP